GDHGDVNYPATSPNVLAVGGTRLTVDPLGNTLRETAWSTETAPDGSKWSTGGGISTVQAQPGYQDGLDPPGSPGSLLAELLDPFSPPMRMTPDVAYDADILTGFAVYDSFNGTTLSTPFGSISANWTIVGGTSAGAPQWAALIAIANQGRALRGLDSLEGGS